jgi:hypothetical protein
LWTDLALIAFIAVNAWGADWSSQTPRTGWACGTGRPGAFDRTGAVDDTKTFAIGVDQCVIDRQHNLHKLANRCVVVILNNRCRSRCVIITNSQQFDMTLGRRGWSRCNRYCRCAIRYSRCCTWNICRSRHVNVAANNRQLIGRDSPGKSDFQATIYCVENNHLSAQIGDF